MNESASGEREATAAVRDDESVRTAPRGNVRGRNPRTMWGGRKPRELAAVGTLLLIGAFACGGRAARDPAEGALSGGTGGRAISEIGGTGGRGGTPTDAGGEPLLVPENWRSREDYGDRPVPYIRNLAIHGVGPHDLFIGGYVAPSAPQFGFVDRWTGESWVPFYETPPGPSNTIAEVWVASASQVFTSFAGNIVLTDGSNEQVWPVAGGVTGIFGFGVDDVLAVGWYGYIVRYDGASWVEEDSGVSQTLYDVWGSDPENVFAVGENGTILHRSASGWDLMPSPTSVHLTGVWGSGPNDVYAVGNAQDPLQHAILHFDGDAWEVVHARNGSALLGVAGRSSSDVCAVGWTDEGNESGSSLILHWDGTSWTELPSSLDRGLSDVWPRGSEEYVTVGDDDMLVAIRL